MQPDRANLLMVFKREGVCLTRNEAMRMAGVQNRGEFEAVVADKCLQPEPWRQRGDRQFSLTERGITQLDMYREVYSFRFG